jgi:hypothetical protein
VNPQDRVLSVHQPQYLPWLGYFDKVAASSVFVFLDRPQYKKREFQNRNRIKGPQGEIWLTVPVLTKGRFDQAIGDVQIDEKQDWRRSHWSTLEQHYRRAPFWPQYGDGLKAFYERTWAGLCDLNMAMTLHFLKELGIRTPVQVESGLGTTQTSTGRIVELCQKTGSDTYLSGSGGKDYMDEGLFGREGLSLQYQRYHHPEYRQQYPKVGFLSQLSIVDLLFNEGPHSLQILRSGAA